MFLGLEFAKLSVIIGQGKDCTRSSKENLKHTTLILTFQTKFPKLKFAIFRVSEEIFSLH